MSRNASTSVSLPALAAVFLSLSALAAPDTVSYSYDANGRVAKADYGGGKSTAYTYDRSGNILTAVTQSPDNTLVVVVSPGAGGSVSGNGISCPATCVQSFSGTPVVTLTASPAAGWRAIGWGGGAAGMQNPASVTMDADKVVTSYFGASSGQTDSDGVADAEEMGAAGTDPAWDGNGDGLSDYQQANVASLHASTGAYVTLAVPQGQGLVSVRAVPNPSPGDAPSGAGFPFGFLSFTVTGLAPGGCTTAVLTLPRSPGLTAYYKYGPTPETPANHWYLFDRSGTTGAAIVHEAARTRVFLDLCDGQRGDVVTGSDGKIVDPGGVAGPASPQLSPSPSSVVFDPLAIGFEATRVVTVTNTGQANLVLGTVGQGDGLAAPFSLAADTCSGATVPPGLSCAITVRFQPTAAAAFADSFSIPSNDPVTNPATVGVSGTGLAAGDAPIPAVSPVGLVLLAALLGLAGLHALKRS